MTSDSTREVTLVVVDRYGEVRGETHARTVPVPYWQETGPVTAAFPGCTILRLLSGVASFGSTVGGRVTYVAQSESISGLLPWRGDPLTLADHPHRMSWAKPGGPAQDIAWASSKVDVTGPPTQHRTWNLSAIWSLPTTQGTVWLKCVPTFFAHEATVLTHLCDGPVPELIAAEGQRLLLAEMPGEDGYEASVAEQRDMVNTLVDMHGAQVSAAGKLAVAGVPDLRGANLVPGLRSLVERFASDSAALNTLMTDLPDRLTAIAECGIPDTLVHGDAHPGNARRWAGPSVWFDWGDSVIGNAMFEAMSFDRFAPSIAHHWLDQWARRWPGSQPDRAWTLLKPIAHLRMASVYQAFLDQIEPAEHIYHRDDVPAYFRSATRWCESSV